MSRFPWQALAWVGSPMSTLWKRMQALETLMYIHVVIVYTKECEHVLLQGVWAEALTQGKLCLYGFYLI